MAPLYKFILDETTGKITVQEINEYGEGKYTNREKYYSLKINGQTYYCYEKDIDRFKSGHVYSFNSDIEHAKTIIWKAITQKYDKAYSEANRWKKVMISINKEWKHE